MKQPLTFLTSVAVPICSSCCCKGSSKADGLVTGAGGGAHGAAGARTARARHLAAACGGSALRCRVPVGTEFLSLAVSSDEETALQRLLSHW